MDTLVLEQKQVLTNEIEPIIQKARALVVKTPEQRTEAVSFADYIKDFKEKIEERFHPTKNKQTAYKAYDDALATEKAFYGPLDEAAKIAKETIKLFDREEAIKAQKAAELAEAKRQEEERKAREKLEEQARKAEEKGKTEKAEALREQAQTVTVAPSFAPAPAATKKLVWKARVSNPLLACKSIGEGLIPFNAVDFKQTALNDLGKNYDGKSKIPGIEFYQDVNGRI